MLLCIATKISLCTPLTVEVPAGPSDNLCEEEGAPAAEGPGDGVATQRLDLAFCLFLSFFLGGFPFAEICHCGKYLFNQDFSLWESSLLLRLLCERFFFW